MTSKPQQPPKTLCHEPDAVVYARENAGLSMTEAAKRIAELGKSSGVGCSLSLLNDIEKGRRNATPDRLKVMAVVYNCPVVILQRKRWAA